MKSIIITAIALSFAVNVFGEDKAAQFKDQKDKFSYAVGLNIGMNFKRQNIDVNTDMINAGVKDGLSGKPQMTMDQIRDVMMNFEKDMQAKQAEVGKKNEADAEKFLADNKKKDGVKTTASGLQYKVMKEGNGAQPKSTDNVTVNYRGTLMDGTEFDSSYKRGQPATFPVAGVIKGWTEALQLMKVGSKYQLFIPPALAYGEHSPSPQIPPNSLLIFEVELMNVQPATYTSPSGASPAPSPSAK
ncbi:MAG TPA: FKBP-type peptidyl-prolyl cis-trans isomerase [Chthoniobacterales bacterium]|nr:FKBP-type peptidyl-prolyl cis-trans isomerase [Chthoniobacterales bacterium]